MVTDVVVANLLRIAREDLDGAQALAALGNRNAAYLCEQAAEKVIRAVLTAEGTHAGIQHKLDEMVDLVPDANPLKPALRAIEELAAYATAYRYPTPAGRIPEPPTGDDLAVLLTRVAVALGEAASRLGVDLHKKGTPAVSAKPLR